MRTFLKEYAHGIWLTHSDRNRPELCWCTFCAFMRGDVDAEDELVELLVQYEEEYLIDAS